MQTKMQLFCFTYAGGNTSFFDQIKLELVGIDLIALEYAGHGSRHKESFYQDYDGLADDLIERLRGYYKGGRYGLFGYSMGSITLIEVLKRIIDRGMRLPEHVFIAAHEPHTKSELLDFMPDEVDEWVKARTIEFGAVPERLINNKVFWRTYLPIYRADYSLIARYDFDHVGLQTKIPASVFYSETDTPYEEMISWSNYFIGKCRFYRYEGKHFFICEHYKEMAKIIIEELGVTI